MSSRHEDRPDDRGGRRGQDRGAAGGRRGPAARTGRRGGGDRGESSPRDEEAWRDEQPPKGAKASGDDTRPRVGGRSRDDRRRRDETRPRQGTGRRSDGDRGRPRADAGGRTDPADAELPIPPEITGEELDDEVRAELSSLSKGAAIAVARHLVMSAHLLDEDPELAYQHAMAARRRAARIGIVREAAGIAAYRTGRYPEALAELRAARRMTGSAEYLPMMADCERGLGRPRRALDLAADPAIAGLDVEGRVEMLIVAAGARRDLGDVAAAVVSLQVPELRSRAKQPWVARLRYAYADLLEAAGRHDEARRWFLRALEADPESTDAIDRVAELDAAT